MGTGNYDVSRVVQRKRTAVLNSFYTTNNTAVNAGNSVLREQPGTQLNDVVVNRNISKGFYTPTGACPCSQDYFINGGGK
jgi:hypothetical protein